MKGVLGCEFNRFDEINILTNFRTNSINIYKSSNDDDVSILLYDLATHVRLDTIDIT